MSRSRFALLWLRNAAALYAGSFTVIELALGAADTSLRSLTTFWGFVFVLWLHSLACIGVGLLLTHLLAAVDRRRFVPPPFELVLVHGPSGERFATVERFGCVDGNLVFHFGACTARAPSEATTS
jgi:hypothetical protein